MENISIVMAEINTDSSDAEKVKSDIREAVNRVTDLPHSVAEKP
jgi:hypothetical protein